MCYRKSVLTFVTKWYKIISENADRCCFEVNMEDCRSWSYGWLRGFFFFGGQDMLCTERTFLRIYLAQRVGRILQCGRHPFLITETASS